MRALAVFVVLIVAAFADEDYCYQDVTRACNSPSSKPPPTSPVKCNAEYGGIKPVFGHLQSFANEHLQRSFDYLLMSTHYANYEKNREGFAKFFRGLSDHTWEKSIELIKYITKRGGTMNFNNRKEEKVNNKYQPYEVNELQSMAKALDMEKALANEAMFIHNEAARRHKDFHDPEVSSYLEKEFMHEQAERIRKLAGYTSDLNKLIFSGDASLGLYMFDDFLQK